MADLRQQFHGCLGHLDVLFLATDVQDLAYLLGAVWLGGDYEGTVEKIDWETVWGLIVSSSDLGNTSVSGHHNDWCLVRLESSVQEREAFDIEHMDLIDEEDTWDNLCASLFSPLGDFLVDLLSDFGLDFSNISCEQGHESLRPRVDDIDFVECHGVHDLLSLLQLTLGALHESSLWSLVIEVAGSGEGFTQLRNLSGGLVDGDDVTSHDLLLLN